MKKIIPSEEKIGETLHGRDHVHAIKFPPWRILQGELFKSDSVSGWSS